MHNRIIRRSTRSVPLAGHSPHQETARTKRGARRVAATALAVGQGGHFLGAAHTLERFRECFYRPLLSSTENFERWTRNGGKDAVERAGEIWRRTLEQYEEPPIDGAVREQLQEYVARRRAELGD